MICRESVVAPPPHTMDADQILQDLLETVSKEQRYDEPDIQITPITSGGANYTSAIYLATISAKDKEQLSLFAKVAIIGDKMRKKLLGDSLFTTERFFYTKLMKIYEGIQDTHQVRGRDRLIFPKFYGCNSTYLQETIVLENLIAKGYGNQDRLKSFDWEYAAAAVTALAKWHALSFAYKRDHPEDFEQVLSERTSIWLQERDEESQKAGAAMIGNSIMAAEEKHRPKIQRYMAEQMETKKFQRYWKPIKYTVLAHGDYRPSNMMSRREEDGSLSVIPVDYQTIQAGRIATDLMYFVFCGADQHFLREHFHQLIDHYYEELRLALHRLDMDVDRVYPRADYDEEVKDTLPFGVFMGVVMLPIILVEAQHAPKLDNGLDELTLKPNEMFGDRFNGILDILDELGVEL